jgi:hypothetical protein
MERKYKVFLDGKLIGTTALEFGDPPMGVAFGQLHTNQFAFGYNYLKEYCQINVIDLAFHTPEENLISSMTIENLKVLNQEGIVIKANANQVTCLKDDYVEISLQGITDPTYEVEFPQHVSAYEARNT